MQKLPQAVTWSGYIVLACVCLKIATFLAKFIKREREIAVLENEYAALLSYRADLLYHYHRAVEEKNSSTMEELKPRVIKITKEIDYLRNEYTTAFKSKTI